LNNYEYIIDRQEKDIQNMITENENLKIILKSYESQNLKITELEVKLRSQQLQYERKLKDIKRETYKVEKIIQLNKPAKQNSYIEEEEICQENVGFINLVSEEKKKS
jgi:hypothetical protein